MRDVDIKRDTMRRALCFLPVCICVLLIVSTCAHKEQIQDDFLQPYVHSGSREALVFVGVSVRFSDREESINAALRDAGRKFSLYNSVHGDSIITGRTGGSVFEDKFTSEYQLQYDKDLDKYIEQLEFDPAKDIFENNNALFVIARVPSGPTMPSASGHSFGGSRPLWIDSPPLEIGGYIAGIGHSDRHNSHRDTVVKSYERAVISIIGSLGSRISSETYSYQGASVFDQGHISATEMTVSGTINNFYVIESWTDPLKLSVWTLAIASRN